MGVLMACGAGALLLRAGWVLYFTGLVRAKNSAGSAMRGVCDFSIAILAFWAVGAAILFASRSFIIMGWTSTVHDPELILLYAVIASFAAAPMIGATAERSRFVLVYFSATLMAGLVVPLMGAWVLRGWLGRAGFVDVAGGSWLHLAAGAAAAVGAWAVGPRNGKYHRDGSASVIPGHNIPQACAGAMVMLVGWTAYAAGCAHVSNGAGALAALDLLLAAAAGTVGGLIFCQLRYGKPDVVLTLMALLGAMAAASAGAGVMSPLAAVIVGATAGALVPWAAAWIDLSWRVDDPTGSIAVHGIGGAWGTILLAIVPGKATIAIQLLGVIVAVALSALASAAMLIALKAVLRVREADEFDGLDLAEHDIAAFPDFQQNTIKSYHLREA
jgi:Amt family ammonium transporter